MKKTKEKAEAENWVPRKRDKGLASERQPNPFVYKPQKVHGHPKAE